MSRSRIFMVLLFCIMATSLYADNSISKRNKSKVLNIVVSVDKDEVKLNDIVTITIDVEIGRYYYINTDKPALPYLIPTKLSLEPADSVEILDITFPKGRKKRVSHLKKTIRILEGKFSITSKAKIIKIPEENKIRGELVFQICSIRTCQPPEKIKFTLPITIKT